MAPDGSERGAPGPALKAAVFLGAALVVGLWFLHAIRFALLVAFFAIVMSIVISAPVTWLERKGVRRAAGALLVFLVIGGIATGVAALIVPSLVQEAQSVARDAPAYADRLAAGISRLVGDGETNGADTARWADLLPRKQTLFANATSFSMSLLGMVAISLVVLAMVIFAVLDPKPLLRLYVASMPARHRAPATRALASASRMVVGWMWSNVIVGAIEAVLAGVVLRLLGVPSALLWAALAFFAELVPKVGLYLMAAPPALIALTDSPVKALWVVAFYVVMNEIMGDVVTPRIRASTMSIHPVSILAVMLAMAAAFGLAGALVATPIAAFVKAYWTEFVLARRNAGDVEPEIDAILSRDPERVDHHGMGEDAGGRRNVVSS